MTVISLRDYAKQKNISYEAVRKQVARYKDELAGHIIMDGRQQFLDEEAVAFLDAKRQKSPVAIIQMDKDEKIEELEAQVKQLLVKTAAQADRLSEMAQWKADNAMLLASAEQTRLALEASEREKKILEGFVADAKAEIAVLSGERDEAKEMARQNGEAAQRAQDELTAAQAAHQQELERKLDEKDRRIQALEQYAAEVAAYEQLRGIKKWRAKKPVPPVMEE